MYNELNALLTSTNKIASAFSSSYIMFIEWIGASMPDSSPAQTCSVPVRLMTSSFRTETITLPAILRKVSPTPVSQTLTFLSTDIKRQDRKASIVRVSSRSIHNFWTTFENTLRRSLLVIPNYWKLEFYASHQHPYLMDLNLL